MTVMHPAIGEGRLAVITGGANGIGLASASRFVDLGMKVCLVDIDEAELDKAVASLGSAAFARKVDVSDKAAVDALAIEIEADYGPVSILMNNAGTGFGARILGNAEPWQRAFAVNFFGMLYGIQAFAPRMIATGQPGAIINTGSKQGITTPPGDTSYNASKAAVKVLTEGLAHDLRNIPDCRISAHLLVPGFTYTGIMKKHIPEKPDNAWDPEQVAEVLIEGLGRGDFYLWCVDNETTREMDEKRILWNARDIIENRPALSRWHPDWKDAFTRHMNSGG